MNEQRLKLRGYFYRLLSAIMAIPAVIGLVVYTFFFIIGEWDEEAILSYLGIAFLCGIFIFIALILLGSSKVYLDGPSEDREEFERIRKKTNKTRFQI